MVKAKRCFIIAEAGVNHNGSEALALELVDIAVSAGADAVKFQTFKADKLVTAHAPKAAYQARETGAGNHLAMLRALELSESAHRNIFEYCKKRGIEFMSTPFDGESANFLINLGMRRIKVPSGELTNRPFIEFLAGFDLPLIVSTGMATLVEVQDAIDWIAAIRQERGFGADLSDKVVLLHCTSNYPAAYEDVNLNAMCAMEESCRLPVGYSDHTSGIAVSVAAVAMGASAIEKHFTSSRELPGPDHKASLEPDELKDLVMAIRAVELALGDGVKAPCERELPIRDVARRSVTLAHDLPAGHRLKASDLLILRPGTGIPPKELNSVIGRSLSRQLQAGTTLKWTDLT